MGRFLPQELKPHNRENVRVSHNRHLKNNIFYYFEQK
jgi:hypothetical protein